MLTLNHKVFGTSYGERPPLIILHGLFGMLDNWQTVGKEVAERCSLKVYVIDQRNHGKSPHTVDFNYNLLVDDLYDFMEQQSIPTAYILGHSMGGKVAMQFAVDNPEKVEKLIVVDIAPKVYPAGHEAIFRALLSLKLDKITSRKMAEAALSSHLSSQAVRQFLLKNLSRNRAGTYDWKFNLEVLHEHYEEILGNTINPYYEFDKEVLFVKGELSARYILPEEDWDVILLTFPNAKLVNIKGAGHWIHAEQPAAFLVALCDFLA